MRIRFPHRCAAMIVAAMLVLTSSIFALAQVGDRAQGGMIRGLVKSGNMPLPGVTVTATNTLTGQKASTWTDVTGSYDLQVPSKGRYVVRTQMAAFAPMTQEIVINDTHPDAQVDLELVLLSRAEQASEQQQTAALGTRGFQSLQVTQSGGLESVTSPGEQTSGASMPGAEVSAATESVAVSGNANNSALQNMNPEEWRQRVEEYRQQQGTPGSVGGVVGAQAGFAGNSGTGSSAGPGGSGGLGGGGLGSGGGFGGPGFVVFGAGPGGFGGGGFGGRGRGRFDINRPHGTLYYSVGDAALNASPYSLSGEPVTKPGYIQHRFAGAIGGPLIIPKIYKGSNKTFYFLNYNGSRGENPYDQYSTVPTTAERTGDFSALSTPIFDPQNGAPFAGNLIPADRIEAAAGGLLNYIPLPNVPGVNRKNFHFVTSANSSSDDLNLRLNRSFVAVSATRERARGPFGGSGSSLSVGFHYHAADANLTNPFPSVGGSTSTRSFDIPVSYNRKIGVLNNVFRVGFNRSRIRTQNLYAFAQDVAGDLGITGVSDKAFDWGLPGLSFTNFGSLQDVTPVSRASQTITLSDFMIWNRGKHTLRWGGDFRRIMLNAHSDSNPRGTFVFTGINTSDPRGLAPGSGFDFADFLLGLPQQTSLQYGQSNHFRGNSWDLFVQDEWRVRGNLTVNLGLRYEYVSPLSETGDLLANLDVAPEFLSNPTFHASNAVVPVQPGGSGPYSGRFPESLVRPDRNNVAPRLGVAWKALSKTLVRAGYGINYNTTAYSTIVQQLAAQPPSATTQTNVQSSVGALSLEDGFASGPTDTVTNNYAVDPNYRLGYLQIWNVNVQQEIRPTLLLNLDYTGTKGTRLDIIEAPNRDATGVRIPTVQAFNWETAAGSSTAHAGSLRVRKRMQGGVSVGGTYTYSKAIDNASSIGGGTTVVAQDPFNLAGERGLSSFDQRHRFTADYTVELPFGKDRHWLRDNGPRRAIFGDWMWSGSWTIASGLPFTPRVLGNFSDVNRGTNGTLRADLLPGEPLTVSNPSIAQWFNTAAFAVPPAGEFGDARRNSVAGPGSCVFNMAFTKMFPMKESRVLEFRAQASNIFNTPQYSSIDTIVNSPTFGQVVSVGAMRTIQLSARFRF